MSGAPWSCTLHRLALTQAGGVCDVSDFDVHIQSMCPMKLLESLRTGARVFIEAYDSSSEGNEAGESEQEKQKVIEFF